MNSGSSWLVEHDDELYLACVMFVGFDADNIGAIHVYKMDFSTEAWSRVRDIGDAGRVPLGVRRQHGSLLPSEPPRA